MDFTTFILENGPEDIDEQIFVDAEQPQRAISWREYASAIKRVAVGMRKLGLAEGDSVALLSSNDISYYVLGDGIVAAGGIFAPISPYGKRGETSQRLKSADAKWVFAAPEFLKDVTAAAESVDIPSSRVLIFDACSAVSESDQNTFSALLRSDESAWRTRRDDASGDQTCYRLLTSGSSGPPKAVELSHKVMIARCQGRVKSRSETRVKTLHVIDFHHMSTGGACNSSALGVHVLYCSKQSSAFSTIDNISKHGIENILLYPNLMMDIVAVINGGERNRNVLASLRDITCGGSVVPGESLKALGTLLPDHTNLRAQYGTTEANIITRLPPGTPMDPGFVGCPVPDLEVIIIDPETGDDVGLDVEGEICVKGPGVFERYFNNEAATEAAFIENAQGRWCRTGDKGHFSSSVQQLAITGRFKDVFVVGSEKVSPDEVEAALTEHDAIVDVGVTSTPDREREGLSEPIAYVVAPDQSLTAQEVVDFAAERLSSFKVPTGGVIFCDDIPRTEGLQKVKRQALEAISGQARSARTLTAAE